MVMRVTNLTQQRSALNNIFRITEDLFNAQKEITSGKQIHKPSDDPAGMRDTLALRTSIKQIKQFQVNDKARPGTSPVKCEQLRNDKNTTKKCHCTYKLTHCTRH